MKALEKELKCKRQAVFFDLEGTQKSSEIIAIGAVKVTFDAKYNVKSIDKKGFKVLVKAQARVGEIVSKLIHITDEMLKNEGIEYSIAIEKFKKYIGRHPENFVYIAYGNYDKTLLLKTDYLNGQNNKEFLDILCKNYLDYSRFLQRFVKNGANNTFSLIEAINVLGGTPLKNIHDPLCDSRNLIILYDSFLQNKSIAKEAYMKNLSNCNLPYPVSHLINQLNKGESVTPAEYKELVDEYFK